MSSIMTWGPLGRPACRDDGGSNEGGRQGSRQGSRWPSRVGSRWPSLDNIPSSELDARAAASLYVERWQIETAFSELALWLNAELTPLGYPRAALLGFSVGLCAYNVMSVVLGALRAVHGDAVVSEEVSGYYIAEQARADGGGLDVLLSAQDWAAVRAMEIALVAKELLQIARRISLRAVQKAKRGAKKPTPPRTKFKNQPHVSTKKLLDAKRSARG